ncbi:MAG: phytanoyl-CoA dioxygenase family protein [Arenicellaceae bacterium]|nr:phytanoyl-CoA dioxygenase family protein [Arenicellaceae bacterium]
MIESKHFSSIYLPALWDGLYLYKENQKRLYKNRNLYRSNATPINFDTFSREGILTFTVEPKLVEELKIELNKHIGYDMDSVLIDEPEARHYVTFSECDPKIKILHDRILAQLDVINIAKQYCKTPNVRISGFKLRIQEADSEFKQNLFKDVGYKVPTTNYMHIDSSFRRSQIKMVFYLNKVTASNGPFRYVRGSHKIKDPIWRKISRRVNHKNGYQAWDAAGRERFMKLPKFLRHKAEFGNDLLPENKYHKILMDEEVTVTSKDGNFVLFDNAGIHRGGLIETGRRISLQWSMEAV